MADEGYPYDRFSDTPPEVVERDLDAVQEHLLADASTRILGVGLTECDGRWVIRAQASTSLATIPKAGPEGTPVLAFREQGVREICTMQVGNDCE